MSMPCPRAVVDVERIEKDGHTVFMHMSDGSMIVCGTMRTGKTDVAAKIMKAVRESEQDSKSIVQRIEK